jgi:hypothetical protein
MDVLIASKGEGEIKQDQIDHDSEEVAAPTDSVRSRNTTD